MCAPALPVSTSKRPARLRLLSPLPVPSRPSRGGCISLGFLDLPVARSGHDFLQVHIDLLTSCVWLVPTFKTATAEIAARNFIADVLRSFACDRCDDWPDFVPLAEFALNDSASSLGSGYASFFADRGQHPRRPLAPPDALDPALRRDSGEAAAHLMGRVTAEVRALLQERQDRRKAPTSTGMQFMLAVGNEALLDTEHRPLPSRSLFSPRWIGPFKVLARTAPNIYRLELPAPWRAFDEFNIEDDRAFAALPPSAHRGGGRRARPMVQVMLKFKLRNGRPYLLVR